MPPTKTLRRLITALPVVPRDGASPGSVTIRIRPMQAADAAYWHVQPLIKAQYRTWSRRAEECGARVNDVDVRWVRADADWNRSRILLLAKAHNLPRSIGAPPSGRAYAWCMEVIGAGGASPMGILTVMPEYVSPISD